MKISFDGPDGRRSLEIDREMSLGRAPENDIAIQDTQISRRHAILRPAEGLIEVRDLDSYNGVIVNGQRISGSVVVGPGDTILFGETTATVALADDATAPRPAAPPVPQPPPASVPTFPVQPPHQGAAGTPPIEAVTAVMPPDGGDSAPLGWSPPAPAIVPRLIVRTGRDEGKELALMEGSDVTIGRDPGLNFVLTDGRVSSRHARLFLSGGQLIVEDLGSANGTYVNGQRVVGRMAAAEDSEIQVGESVLIFTRRPPSFFAGAPAPTLVGARIDTAAEVQAAVEQAVLRSEKRQRSRLLLYSVIGGAVAVAAAGIVAGLLVAGRDGSPSEAEVIERVKPATVRIDSYNDRGIPISGGSGSIIDLDRGFILTNNHVASVGHLEVVNSVNNQSIEAVLHAAAPCDDLALVRAEGLRGAAPGLKQVEFGDMTKVRQGDPVIALGYPGAAEQFLDRALSASRGIVSKTRTVYDLVGSGVPLLPNVIQTDAAINPGNSGGPLFDLDGKQIGVNTARYTGPAGAQLENYAIAVTRVLEILDTLKAGRSPKWIGATFAELINRQTGEPVALGIEEVTPGGPAERLGLAGHAGGDYQFLLVGIDGEEVLTLQDYCRMMPDQGTVTIAVYVVDDDEVREVEVEVGGTGG